jgi:phage-related protein
MSIISASEQAMETSLDLLNTYVAIPTEQTLSMTMAGSAVRNIQASVNRKPDVRIEHNASNSALARVALEFVCTKPFWRSGTQLTSTTTIDASPKAITLNNTGGAPERQPNIVITGPFTSMTIANSTTSTSMTYAGSIGGSETVTIGVNTTGEWTAVYSVGTANVIGNITHTGDSTFMAFNPGNNSLSVTSAGGDNTGTLNFNFYPPYL